MVLRSTSISGCFQRALCGQWVSVGPPALRGLLLWLVVWKLGWQKALFCAWKFLRQNWGKPAAWQRMTRFASMLTRTWADDGWKRWTRQRRRMVCRKTAARMSLYRQANLLWDVSWLPCRGRQSHPPRNWFDFSLHGSMCWQQSALALKHWTERLV